jgi:hypothetical protein
MRVWASARSAPWTPPETIVSDPAVAGPYLLKYYGMQIAVPNYVGGYFWWYFRENMIPMAKPLFAALSSAMR